MDGINNYVQMHSSNAPSVIERLPNELMLQIFSWLSAKELCTCSQVSRRWRELSNDNDLWRRFLGSLTVPKDVDIKKMLVEQSIPSMDNIRLEWKKFLSNMSDGSSGRFKVLFRHNPSLIFNAAVSLSKARADKKSEFDVEVTRIVMIREEEETTFSGPMLKSLFVNGKEASYSTNHVLPNSYLELHLESIEQIFYEIHTRRYEKSLRNMVHAGWKLLTGLF